MTNDDDLTFPGAKRIVSKGKGYWYFYPEGQGKGKPSVRLGGDADHGTPEFIERFKAARGGSLAPVRKPAAPTVDTGNGDDAERRHADKDLAWLCNWYVRESVDFKSLDPKTQGPYEFILSEICATPYPKSGTTWGGLRYKSIQRDHIQDYLLPTAERPRPKPKPDGTHAMTTTRRNAYVRVLSAMFSTAKDRRPQTGCVVNPVEGVKRTSKGKRGHKLFSVEQCQQFEARWPHGTMERFVYEFARETGQRASDLIRLGRDMLVDGELRDTQKKNGNSKVLNDSNRPESSELIVRMTTRLAALLADYDATFRSPYLRNTWGKPWSAKGLAEFFERAIHKAGLPSALDGEYKPNTSLTIHGLRHRTATDVARASGGDTRLLKAKFGWRTNAMPEHYTRQAGLEEERERADDLLAKERERQAGGPAKVVKIKRKESA